MISSNSEANASELLENREDMFPRYLGLEQMIITTPRP